MLHALRPANAGGPDAATVREVLAGVQLGPGDRRQCLGQDRRRLLGIAPGSGKDAAIS